MPNVLIVDDQPANLLALEVLMEGLGTTIFRAQSGEEALILAEQHDFAVVLLDVQMHGIDGYETARRMRTMPCCKQTPIIFVTAFEAERRVQEQAFQLGGSIDFVSKPISPVIMRAKIAGFVELFEYREMVKRQAEQLRQFEQQKFFRFMENLPGLAWIKDLQGNYIYVNHAAERAFGLPTAQLYGKSDRDIFPPETAKSFQTNDRAALLSKNGIQVVETLHHPGGDVRYSMVSKFPILGLEDKPGFVGGIAIDITDRLKAEDAQKAAIAELSRADQRKNEFLATLAHELRNPLAPLRNALRILEIAGENREAVENAKTIMDRQVQHMVRLIDDLLDVSRISRGKLQLKTELIDLHAVVTTTAQSLQPTIEASRHELVLEMTESQILVDADPVRISQVITNLLNNAVKFSPPKTRITLKLWRVEEYAFISVRDEGIGIRAEDLSSIFEMFRQLDQRLERVTGGLGIGLTLAKELVEKHGGAIEVHSEGVSRGSEFIVSLPLSARSTLNAPTPASSDEPNSIDSTHRILIADDNVPAATTLAEYFKLRGHETCAVFDGSSAVETGNFFKPDVVVLDIGMPNLNGYEAARAIRATDWGRKATILCLTGFGDERHQREARNAGFSMLFRKPVNPEEILEYLSHKPLPN